VRLAQAFLFEPILVDPICGSPSATTLRSAPTVNCRTGLKPRSRGLAAQRSSLPLLLGFDGRRGGGTGAALCCTTGAAGWAHSRPDAFLKALQSLANPCQFRKPLGPNSRKATTASTSRCHGCKASIVLVSARRDLAAAHSQPLLSHKAGWRAGREQGQGTGIRDQPQRPATPKHSRALTVP